MRQSVPEPVPLRRKEDHGLVLDTRWGTVILVPDEDVGTWVAAESPAVPGTLEPRFRPSLAQLRSLRGLRPRPSASPMSAFVAVDEPFGSIPEPCPDTVFVTGAVAAGSQAVARILEAGAEPAWVPCVELHAKLSAAARGAIRRIPGAEDLVAAATNPDRPPVVDSERMRTALGAIRERFLQTKNRAVLLKGVAGVGKSMLVDVLCRDLVAMRVPRRLQGMAVASIGIDFFLQAGGQDEERRSAAVLAELARHRVIWVLDEASRLVDKYGNTSALNNLLLLVNAGGFVILISDESSLLEKRVAFRRRFCNVYLSEAGPAESLSIVAAVAEHQARLAGTGFGPGVLRRTVGLSRVLGFAQPHAAVDLAARAIAAAEDAGEADVTLERLLKTQRGMLAQGDPSPPEVRTVDDFVSRMRDAGFRGHGGFLRDFGAALVDSQQALAAGEEFDGVFLAAILVGPPGVGKTTFANCLARVLVSSTRKMLVLRGADYAKAHAVQTLKGAPVSYVGFDRGSLIGNHVHQNPDGILLIEEPELAHPDLTTLLLEILDGSFTCGDGTSVRCAGLTVLIATNCGCDGARGPVGFSPAPAADRVATQVSDAVAREFDSRLRDRLSDRIFVLGPIGQAALRNIVRLLCDRLGRSRGVRILASAEAIAAIVNEAGTRNTGARPVKAAFRRFVAAPLRALLAERQHEAVAVITDPTGRIEVHPVDGIEAEETGRNTECCEEEAP